MNADLSMIGAALVDRLLYHGADVMVADDGRVFVCFPEPGCGRRPNQSDDWQRGYTDGAMRELWELVQLVPAAREMVASNVRAYPSAKYTGGLMA